MRLTKQTRHWLSYIISCCDTACLDIDDSNLTQADKVTLCLDQLYADSAYNRQRYKHDAWGVKETLQGLPSYMQIEFMNYKILELGKSFGYVFKTEYLEDKFIDQYWLKCAVLCLSLHDLDKSELNKLLNRLETKQTVG